MARYLPATRPPQDDILVPLTLTQLQLYVGGFIAFLDLPDGDLLVVNEASLDQLGEHNKTASAIARRSVYGDVVLCRSADLA